MLPWKFPVSGHRALHSVVLSFALPEPVIALRHRLGDATLTVLEEILDWSQDRPAWQRDALRRLVLNDELSDDDIRDLSEMCKSVHGLAERQEVVPLAKDHVPGQGSGSAKVTLVSIFHHRGVNALAEERWSRELGLALK